MYLKPAKPKVCPCGRKFTPRGIQKYHDKACELKFKTGNVDPENLINLPLPVLKSMATGAFQAWIKNRDKDKPCYTCGALKAQVWHASHFVKKELFSGMICNEKACKKCCDHCNVGLDGNLVEFEKKLIAEFKIGGFIDLENEAITTKRKSWSRLELIEVYNKYK